MELSWPTRTDQRLDTAKASRKRTAKACDNCSKSRTRCDGESPCLRCKDRGRTCRYNRRIKKRGRIPYSQRTYGHASAMQRNVGDATSEERSLLPERVQSWPSTSVPSSCAVVDRHVAHPLPGNVTDSSITQGSPLSSTIFTHLDGVNLSLPQSNTTQSSSNADNPEVSPCSMVTLVSHKSLPDCRYGCLEPLLPFISEVISPSVACDLLDAYFVEPRSSIFACASLYVLVPIIRKKSLLAPLHPRPTTRALLCTILWCASQTADIVTFHMPGSRSQISNRLYEIATVLIAERDPDFLRRVPDGLRSEITRLENLDAHQPRLVPASAANEPAGLIDDVLTFTLLAVTISGGDFKSDSLKWWNKAVRLALALGLNREDEIEQSSRSFLTARQGHNQAHHTVLEAEIPEECRRIFWLLYCLDRHLGLSFNSTLKFPDEICAVFAPLPDTIWENLDTAILTGLPPRVSGPPMTVQGPGFFEYFLPLMAILGDIIYLHHRRNHPRFGALDESNEVTAILELLHIYGASLVKMASDNNLRRPSTLEAYAVDIHDSQSPLSRFREALSTNLYSGSVTRTQLVIAYSTHILHVLYVLLHGKWDVICMLDSEDDWITSMRFTECSSHAISASHALSEILELDPDLMFMPYLFGIYLLHGSFILLLFADRMPLLGANDSVVEACETIIRAHEICVVMLSTEFQRNFRKVLRSTMNSVRGYTVARDEESRARRKVLSLYRWTKGARGLCL